MASAPDDPTGIAVRTLEQQVWRGLSWAWSAFVGRLGSFLTVIARIVAPEVSGRRHWSCSTFS
jgi:hypothetical protein